jgi:guanine nucleotide-binding protein G(I)/G(S)/G(T) subunit beta-1
MSVAMEKRSGQFVCAGGLDNVCTVYKIGGEGQAQLKSELVSHEGYLSDCKFFHSPSKILTSSGDHTSLLWDVEKGTILTTFAEHKNSITSAELVGTSGFLTCGVDKTIKLWDVRSNASTDGSVQTFTGHGSDVNGITMLQPTGGTSFATCSEDGTVRVWDTRAYGEVARFGQFTEQSERDPFSDGDNGFTSITSSKSGRLLFCGHSEGSVVCYDVLGSHNPVQSTYVIKDAHEEHISCIKASPTGEVLCTGSWDFNVKLFG